MIEVVTTPARGGGRYVWGTDWLTKHYVTNLESLKVLQQKGKWDGTITDLTPGMVEYAMFDWLDRGEEIPPLPGQSFAERLAALDS